MKKYRHMWTREIKTAYQIGHEFLLRGWKEGEEGDRPPHPDRLTREDIIREGVSIAEPEDDETDWVPTN